MSFQCDITEHSDLNYIQYILSLNDSMLQNMISYLNLNEDPDTFRRDLQNKIPGRLLVQCQIFHLIWKAFPPILFLLGTLGNTIAFCVLVQRKLIRVSTYYYLAVLTCFDESILIIGLLRRWVDKITGFSSENNWLVCCQVFQFIGVATSLMSVWLIVVVTIERLIVIKLPLRVHSYVSIKKTKLIIISLFIITMAISSHFFETVTLNRRNFSKNLQMTSDSRNHSSLICDFKTEYATFAKIWTFLDAFLYSCLPLVLMITMNVVIGHGIYQADRNREEMVPMNSSDLRKIKSEHLKKSLRTGNRICGYTSRQSAPLLPNRETRQLTIMLLVVSCTFLITTTPLVLLKFFIKLNLYRNSGIPYITKLELMDTIFEMLMYTNHAINFLLYCASGKKFRYHVKRFFESFCCGKNHDVTTQYNRITFIPHDQSMV